MRHAVNSYNMDALIRSRDELRDIIIFQLAPSNTPIPANLGSKALASKPATTISDIGILVDSVNISYSVPEDYRALLTLITQEKRLEEEARKQELEIANAKRDTQINQSLAEGKSALERSSDLGQFWQKWNGSLPNTIVIGSADLESIRRFAIADGPSSKDSKKN